MNRRVLSCVVCGFVSATIVCVSAYPMAVAQETGKAGKAEGGKKVVKPGDRLPANYAKIGVSDDQRKKIYEIQSKYSEQITNLQKQLAELKSKENAEVEAVLTAEQKKALQAANDETKKKAAEKKKGGEKEKGAEKSEK